MLSKPAHKDPAGDKGDRCCASALAFAEDMLRNTLAPQQERGAMMTADVGP